MDSSHQDLILDQFTRQAAPFSAAPSIRNEDALQRIVRMADAGPEDSVLDVACGPGLLACAFAPLVRHVTGLDVTPAMLAQARALQHAKAIRNVTWDLAAAPPLPYSDGHFSIVTCRFSFHHLLDPLAVLVEMRRVCQGGGRVVVADLTPDALKAEAFNAAEKMRDPSHVRAMPVEELRVLFERAGLSGNRCESYRLENELEDLLSRSFPQPGDAERLRYMYAGSLTDDSLGIEIRSEDDKLRFGFPITIVAATHY